MFQYNFIQYLKNRYYNRITTKQSQKDREICKYLELHSCSLMESLSYIKDSINLHFCNSIKKKKRYKTYVKVSVHRKSAFF